MTSTTKIHGMANTRELLRTFYAIRNDLISYEARDPITKQTYPIPSFLKMCLLHVPTKAEMNGKGMRKKNWKIPHFLPTADYFIEHAGFPPGKLPSHEEWCEYRNDSFTVYVNVFGEVLRVDDAEVIEMYDELVNFPIKLYNDVNRQFINALQKNFADPIDIDDDEPFGALMAFQRHVVWKMVKQCIDAYPQIARSLGKLEISPLTSRNDVERMRKEAMVLLPFKEMSTCRPKFTYDNQCFSNVLSSLESQEGFAKEGDRARATKTIRLLQGIPESGNTIPRETFFDRLSEIFLPNIGLNDEDAEAHLASTAFQAREMSGQRGQGAQYRNSKENMNPQTGKRKAPADEQSMLLKNVQDLKSELGNVRSQMQAICEHFGITCKKIKTHDDSTAFKQGKAHAGFASAKTGKGKSQKKVLGVSFPRNLVAKEDDTASDSDGQQDQVEHAMFARVQMKPMPKLTIESIYGPKSRIDLTRPKSQWDMDRFGYYNPRPDIYEEDFSKAKLIHNDVNAWDDDRVSTASSKTSLSTSTQFLSLGDKDQYAKMLEVKKQPLKSPHADRLLEDYRKNVEHIEIDQATMDDDCVEYIPESKSKEEEDYGQELDDDHPPTDDTAAVLKQVFSGRPRTRHVTRMESFTYPKSVIPGEGDEDAGSMSDSKHDKRRDDESDEDRSIQVPTAITSKTPKRPGSATPRSAKLPAPLSGAPAPTAGNASGSKYDLRKPRPPTATEVFLAWPPLSAPGATCFDQHDDTSNPATTSPPGAYGTTMADM